METNEESRNLEEPMGYRLNADIVSKGYATK